MTTDTIHATPNYDRTHTNAALIAAAPDLLAALERLADEACYRVDPALIAEARAAIAKAKGEK